MIHRIVHATFVIAFFWVFLMPKAHAYIDPGTGSMLLQALLAAFFAVLLFGKNIYYRILGIVKPGEKTEGEGGGETPERKADGDE